MNKELNALFSACAVVNNRLFCVTDVEHIFIWIDIYSGKVEYIDQPKGFVPKEWSGTDRMVVNRNDIYILEQNGKRILKYSILDNSCRYIDINCNIYQCNNFVGAVNYENHLYIFPRFKDGLIKFDLLSEKVQNIGKLCPEINYTFKKKEKLHYGIFSCSCQIEDTIWIFSEKMNLVNCYDFTKREIKKYMLPKSIKGSVQICRKGRLFYILSLEGIVYSWDIQRQEVCELYSGGKDKIYPYFWQLIAAGTKLWVLPCFGEEIVVLDTSSGENITYKEYPRDFKYYADSKCSKYSFFCEDKINYYFAMHSGNYILSIDKRNGKERWIKPKVDSRMRALYYVKYQKHEVIKESEYHNLPETIDLWKEIIQSRVSESNKLGQLIYKVSAGRKQNESM